MDIIRLQKIYSLIKFRDLSKKLVEEILHKIIFDEIKENLLKDKLLEIELPEEDKDYLRFIEIAEPLRIHISSKLYHGA